MTVVEIAILYVGVAVVVAGCAVMIGTDPRESRRAQRNAARVGLLAMFWPALAVSVVVIGIVKAWRASDWGTR